MLMHRNYLIKVFGCCIKYFRTGGIENKTTSAVKKGKIIFLSKRIYRGVCTIFIQALSKLYNKINQKKINDR